MESSDDEAYALALDAFEQQRGGCAAPPLIAPVAQAALTALRDHNGAASAAPSAPPMPPPPPAARPPMPSSGLRSLFCRGGGEPAAPPLQQEQQQPQIKEQQHVAVAAAAPRSSDAAAAAAGIMPAGAREQDEGQPPVEQQQQQQQVQQREQVQPAEQHPPAGPAAPAAVASGVASGAATAPSGAAPKRRLNQLFDFLVVYDLEATCAEDKTKQPQPQEIIELSAVIVQTSTLTVLPATFQRYVRPDQHPVLTPFCTQLTGITQEMVDAGIPLRQALAEHDTWLREQGLIGKGKTFVPVTWRDWDLRIAMAMECKWRKIEQPKYLLRWIDLAKVLNKHSKHRGNLRESVEAAGLTWQGRAHSAIDDARNTARLAIKVMSGGVILGVTGSFTGVDSSGRLKQATLQLGGKPSGGGGGATSGGSKSGGVQLGYRASGGPPQQGTKRKAAIFGKDGAWNGQCYCGVKAKQRQVKTPGPNNGRSFMSCGRFSMTGGGAQCDFFQYCSSKEGGGGKVAGGGDGKGPR